MAEEEKKGNKPPEGEPGKEGEKPAEEDPDAAKPDDDKNSDNYEEYDALEDDRPETKKSQYYFTPPVKPKTVVIQSEKVETIET